MIPERSVIRNESPSYLIAIVTVIKVRNVNIWTNSRSLFHQPRLPNLIIFHVLFSVPISLPTRSRILYSSVVTQIVWSRVFEFNRILFSVRLGLTNLTGMLGRRYPSVLIVWIYGYWYVRHSPGSGSGHQQHIVEFLASYNPDHIVNHIHSSGKGTYCPEDVRMFFQFYDTRRPSVLRRIPVISFFCVQTAHIGYQLHMYVPRYIVFWKHEILSVNVYVPRFVESYGTFEWVYLYICTPRVARTVTFVSPYPFRTHVSVAMISSLTYSLEREAKSTGDKISATHEYLLVLGISNIIYRFQHTVRFCIVSRVQNLETQIRDTLCIHGYKWYLWNTVFDECVHKVMFSEKKASRLQVCTWSIASQQHVVIFDHVRDYYRRATVVACNVTMDIHLKWSSSAAWMASTAVGSSLHISLSIPITSIVHWKPVS
jgi:hypothetical protein